MAEASSGATLAVGKVNRNVHPAMEGAPWGMATLHLPALLAVEMVVINATHVVLPDRQTAPHASAAASVLGKAAHHTKKGLAPASMPPYSRPPSPATVPASLLIR